jgi:putative PIN family toxin of toxin-antitoxin system
LTPLASVVPELRLLLLLFGVKIRRLSNIRPRRTRRSRSRKHLRALRALRGGFCSCRVIAPVLSISLVDERVVMDTNVFVASLRSEGGASRAVLRLCLARRCKPLMGEKLFNEFVDVLAQPHLFDASPLSAGERDELLDAFLGVCEWIPVFFLWRPNLPDEGDNHLIELAVAGGASALITQNTRDLQGGELRFPQLKIETPADFMKHWRQRYGDHDDKNS